jgi:short-subunit dehydrogenase
VVNNAGYSLSGDTESATEEEMHQEMETLFFGTVRVTTRAIAVMRQDKTDDGVHRGGIVFNISSLAGIVGLPGHSFYHAGKFAVEGWSESVAREMHPDWNSGFPLSPFPPFLHCPPSIIAIPHIPLHNRNSTNQYV